MSNENLGAAIFDGLQIKAMIKDATFANSMTDAECSSWNSFVKVIQNFLENNKADNYKELVDNMLNKFKIGANMNIKIHLDLAIMKIYPKTLVI